MDRGALSVGREGHVEHGNTLSGKERVMYFIKGWYSSRLSDRAAAKAGHRHGRDGQDPMPELVIHERLNADAEYDPGSNEHHADLEARSKRHPKLGEWESGVQAAEKALTKYPNRWLLRVIFLFLLGVEFFGIATLLDGQGMENPHKTIVALAGACILFYLTYYAAKGAES